MKTQFLLIPAISFLLLSCERPEQPKPPTPSTPPQTNLLTQDRSLTQETPFDQSENQSDLDITQKIRQALVSDDSLSTNAKNIKIITNNGVVTLRGSVGSDEEKANIEDKVNGIQGIQRVDNQLEVEDNNSDDDNS